MFFFVQDWMGDVNVQAMTWAERGIYHWLLCQAWQDGGIPADPKILARVLGLSLEEFEAAWEVIGRCWVPHPDDGALLVNPRQEREREIRAAVSSKRASAGSLGGSQAKRKQTPSKLQANCKQTEAKGKQDPPLAQAQAHTQAPRDGWMDRGYSLPQRRDSVPPSTHRGGGDA